MASKATSRKKSGASVDIVLPSRVETLGKSTFDPRTDVWSYRENTLNASFNFKILNVSKGLLLAFKAVLIWYAENRSGAYTKNMFVRVAHLFQFLQTKSGRRVDKITVADILNYKASLTPDTQWYVRSVGIFLCRWYALGYRSIDDSVIGLFKQLRLPSNARGVAVLTMDPLAGPFTDLEVEAIQAALNTAYSADVISNRRFVLVWLFLLLGQRPTQYANLRLCDFSTCAAADGSISYLLQVPRAKQREGYSRSSFTPRALVSQFGYVLQGYVNGVRVEFIDKLNDPDQAPMFPRGYNDRAPKGFEFHPTSADIGTELKDALSQLQVLSERTGDQVHITATRFRRTVGTRAAAEGHGELIIAELLDHSDTSNAGIYVQATPAIVERIDRAIAQQLAPLAQAFAGVLIRDESEAVRGDDPRSRIIDLRLDGGTQPMGNCGKYGFCGFAAPIACYTCANFQPWLDGPHEAVLSQLLEERERLVRETDIRIAAINDRTILAVAEVVRRCEATRVSGADSHG